MIPKYNLYHVFLTQEPRPINSSFMCFLGSWGILLIFGGGRNFLNEQNLSLQSLLQNHVADLALRTDTSCADQRNKLAKTVKWDKHVQFLLIFITSRVAMCLSETLAFLRTAKCLVISSLLRSWTMPQQLTAPPGRLRLKHRLQFCTLTSRRVFRKKMQMFPAQES